MVGFYCREPGQFLQARLSSLKGIPRGLCNGGEAGWAVVGARSAQRQYRGKEISKGDLTAALVQRARSASFALGAAVCVGEGLGEALARDPRKELSVNYFYKFHQTI